MSETNNRSTAVSGGCLGPLVAAFLSIKTWGWTWWLLLHAPLGWIYVAYWIVFRSGWLQ